MAVLWILEKPGKNLEAVASFLQGDFAVRCFASLASLRCLAKLSQTIRPDMILVDCDDYPELEQADLKMTFVALQPTTVRVYLTSRIRAWVRDSLDVYYPKEQMSHLSFHLRSLVLERFGASAHDGLDHLAHQLGSIEFDFHGLTLLDQITGEVVTLSLKEAKILRLMMEHKSRCVSRDVLMSEVWPKIKVSPRTIDSHISRLRKRIEPIGLMIESQYGSGYILRSEHL
ncbi:MAG: winged helix-turn-helix domain-containing protein [Oligoflexus sp.]